MSKLPTITGRDTVRAFERAGFVMGRVRGSHHILKKAGIVYHLSVPVHGKRAIAKGTLRRLIKISGLSEDEFIQLL